MLCESCGIEMRIVNASVAVSGDDSPDTQTKVVRVQTLKCMNPSCPRPQIKTIEHEMPFQKL